MKDKLFLLSREEVKKYLPNKSTRIRKMKGRAVFWWLRSPGNNSSSAMFVSYIGEVILIGNFVGLSNHKAVCPALHLNPESLNKLPRSKKGYVQFGNRKWQVLNENTGLLLSKRAIFFYKFDDKSNDYENSVIRKFLNEELLYTLFTEEEIEKINDTEIAGEVSRPVKDGRWSD